MQTFAGALGIDLGEWEGLVIEKQTFSDLCKGTASTAPEMIEKQCLFLEAPTFVRVGALRRSGKEYWLY
jgi:hypothetical protein